MIRALSVPPPKQKKRACGISSVGCALGKTGRVGGGNTGGGGEAAKSKWLVPMEYRQDGCITKNIDFRTSWTEGCCPRAKNDDDISC